MILQNEVEIKIGCRNFKHYKELGYNNIKIGDVIKVPLNEIMRNTSIKVLCKCEDCGLERNISYDSLVNRKNSSFNINGETLCSKCANKRMSGVNNAKFKHGSSRYCEYRNNAKRRNIEFQITSDEFKYLISQECYYCGGYSIEYNKDSRGNGIDRKDNNRGYIFDNCVPCSWVCNCMKSKMDEDNFLNHISKIYKMRVENYEISQ
ncbi:MAG: hypothetical protein NC124_20125 [Clostridium sp.]|nr:hypothetical protein [Clostridium sp.]